MSISDDTGWGDTFYGPASETEKFKNSLRSHAKNHKDTIKFIPSEPGRVEVQVGYHEPDKDGGHYTTYSKLIDKHKKWQL